MKEIQDILSVMNDVVSNPGRVVRDYKAQTGKAVIGCFPVYCPEEIVHAAGMLPVGMWGGSTRVSKAFTIVPSFCCSIMQSNIELAMNGIYRDLDAVIMSSPCDTLKSIPQDWLYTIPDIPVIQIVYPQMRKLDAGIKYLKTEFQRIVQSLEQISGEPITDGALQNSIEIYNEHRQVMRDFCAVTRKYPATVTPSVRHLVIKSGYFMEKKQHTLLVRRFIEEISKFPPVEWNGKSVILTGITAEPNEFLELLNENGLTVVGDDLAQESRQFRTDVPDGSDPLLRLANQWALIEGCSLAFDPQKKRGQMIVDMARETDADGIILCMMKFCDPEEFDYPILASEFEAAGIPLLYVEIDQQRTTMEQERTRIQSFAEMLSSKY